MTCLAQLHGAAYQKDRPLGLLRLPAKPQEYDRRLRTSAAPQCPVSCPDASCLLLGQSRSTQETFLERPASQGQGCSLLATSPYLSRFLLCYAAAGLQCSTALVKLYMTCTDTQWQQSEADLQPWCPACTCTVLDCVWPHYSRCCSCARRTVAAMLQRPLVVVAQGLSPVRTQKPFPARPKVKCHL